jgi:Phosphodiester glycosidase
LRSVRVTLSLAAGVAGCLALAPQALATTPRVAGPIVSYRCPPAPLFCSRALKPGVTLTHLRAKMHTGPSQDIYKLSWKLGDPHVRLFAEALSHPTVAGSIQLNTISNWAGTGAPAGFLGAINADFFSQGNNWRYGKPSGMLVQGRHVYDFGSGGPAVGYQPAGRMVMGSPIARAAKITLTGGHTATIGAFNPSSTDLSSVRGDQVAVKTGSSARVPRGWVGFVVTNAKPNFFADMLRGSQQVSNSSGLKTGETVRGFRFGEGTGTTTTTQLQVVSSATCGGYVCHGQVDVALAGSQALVIAKTAHFAAGGLVQRANSNAHAFTISTDTPRWAGVSDVMGGKPRLVKDGRASYPAPWVNPPMMSSDGWQWDYPHWRPAVAETATRGWLIITGGVRYADGVAGWNWSKMLVQLGARNAIGFDNNSSTELYVPGRGTWTFSPGWQRPLTEATALTYR